MKANLEALNRSLLIKAMKTLLFAIPIGIITNNIYVATHGKYIWTWNVGDLSLANLVFTVVVFCLLFVFFYALELYILPFIMIITNNGKMEDDFTKDKIKSNVFLTNQLGWNPLVYIKKANIDRLKFYSIFTYFSVVCILWILTINNTIGYLAILLVLFLTYKFGKILKYIN